MSISSSNSARTAVAGWIARLRPSSPDSPPSPLRRRKQRRVDGAAGHDHQVALHAQPCRRRPCAASTPRARPPSIRIRRGPAAGVGGGAGVPRLRHVDLARCAAWPPSGSRRRTRRSPRSPCALRKMKSPYQPRASAPRLTTERVAAGQLGRHLRHVQLALDAAEERVERLGGELLEAEALGPQLEHRRRRAEAGAGVHQRGAAHGLPERQHDRHVADGHGLAGVAVEERGHLARPRGHVVGREALALLEHHHAHAALGQLLGHRRAAGAGADHAHVGAHHPLARDAAAALDPHLGRPEHAAPVACRPRRWSRGSRPRLPRAQLARAAHVGVGVVAQPQHHARRRRSRRGRPSP